MFDVNVTEVFTWLKYFLLFYFTLFIYFSFFGNLYYIEHTLQTGLSIVFLYLENAKKRTQKIQQGRLPAHC